MFEQLNCVLLLYSLHVKIQTIILAQGFVDKCAMHAYLMSASKLDRAIVELVGG